MVSAMSETFFLLTTRAMGSGCAVHLIHRGDRVGGRPLVERPSSHTTVRTVRYTAVQPHMCKILAPNSFFPLTAVGAPRFCISFVFHTICLQEALVSKVFCFQHTNYLQVFTQDFAIVRPFPDSSGTMVSADFLQFVVTTAYLCRLQDLPG